MTRQIGVFRLQLFKPSEAFIRSQASQMTRYRPLYIGRRLFGDSFGERTITPSRTGDHFNLISMLRLYGLRDPREFIRALEHEQLSLIHAHFGVDGVFAAPLAKRLRVPLVTTLHGFDVTRTDADMICSFRPALVNGVLFRRSLQRDGNLFICVSEFVKRKAIAFGYPQDRLLVHYIGIDCDQLKARLSPGDDGLIVHVGRLVEKKGTSYLLRAFATLKSDFPEAKLVVIGDGPLRQSLEQEARKLGVAERCQFLGMLPNEEVVKWIQKAAFKVVPSVTAANGDSEGFGIVNIEAGAQGVPVLAFDSGGIGEAVVDGKTGMLSPEKDVQKLAGNMATLLANRDLRLSMGMNARRYVEDNFNIRRQTAALEDHYDALLKGRL